jgi:hypothetical protein
MVSSELGLIVEAIPTAYPDCEAKRCIDRRHNRWQSVQIEFEFSSSRFREHRHDPARCDVIVCWDMIGWNARWRSSSCAQSSQA